MPDIFQRAPLLVTPEVRLAGGHAVSEDSEGEGGGEGGGSVRLRLKGTFIDVEDELKEQLSPRAFSDPGSEVSSGYGSYFSKEQTYVAGLSEKVTQTLASQKHRHSKGSKGSFRSGDSVDLSDSGGYNQTTMQVDSSEDCSVSRQGSLSRESSFQMPNISPIALAQGYPANFFKIRSHHSGGGRHRGCAASSNSSESSFMNNPHQVMDVGHSPDVRMSQDDLRNLVHRKTAEINDVLKCQRLSTALTSINEIPEQVQEVLHQRCRQISVLDSGLLDAVDVATNLIQDAVNDSTMTDAQAVTAEQAAESITMIPDMIMASFENNFAKAMSTVRIRVDDVIQGLEASDMTKEQMVKQMWAIPEEIRQITREAVNEASQQSRDNVEAKLDRVLGGMAEESMPDGMWQAKRQIVASVPKKLPDTLRMASEAVENNVCQAVKFVQANSDVTGVVANRVVADTLLRAKQGPALKADTENPGLDRGLDTLRVINPGSVGHPDLCSRPCLYFAVGKCQNGVDCAFCHGPHTKRTAHLDKRHREMLRVMDFAERFALICPLLKAKLQSLEVNSEVMMTLESLEQMTLKTSNNSWAKPDRRRSKETRTLQIALKFMSVRSLLTLLHHALHHAPLPDGSPQHAAVEALMRNIRPNRHSAHESEAQSQSQRSNGRSRATGRSRTPSQGSGDEDLMR